MTEWYESDVCIATIAQLNLRWDMLEKGYSLAFETLLRTLKMFHIDSPQVSICNTTSILNRIKTYTIIFEEEYIQDECTQLVHNLQQMNCGTAYLKKAVSSQAFFKRIQNKGKRKVMIDFITHIESLTEEEN